MDENNQKNATINIKLKADSGYQSEIKGKIYPFQWGLINRVLGNEEKIPRYSTQNMIDFAIDIMKRLARQDNGNIYQFFEKFITDNSLT